MNSPQIAFRHEDVVSLTRSIQNEIDKASLKQQTITDPSFCGISKRILSTGEVQLLPNLKDAWEDMSDVQWRKISAKVAEIDIAEKDVQRLKAEAFDFLMNQAKVHNGECCE